VTDLVGELAAACASRLGAFARCDLGRLLAQDLCDRRRGQGSLLVPDPQERRAGDLAHQHVDPVQHRVKPDDLGLPGRARREPRPLERLVELIAGERQRRVELPDTEVAEHAHATLRSPSGAVG
jgi:hypothetical protein